MFPVTQLDLTILELLKENRDQGSEGLLLSEVNHIFTDYPRSNLHRVMNKLMGYALIERTVYSENSDIKYFINLRGLAYLEANELIEKYQLDKKYYESESEFVIKVQYWAGNKVIHEFFNQADVKRHYTEDAHDAFYKNHYRVFYEDGTLKDIPIGKSSCLEEIEYLSF